MATKDDNKVLMDYLDWHNNIGTSQDPDYVVCNCQIEIERAHTVFDSIAASSRSIDL